MGLTFLPLVGVSATLAASPVPIHVAPNIVDGAVSVEKVAIAGNASKLLAAQLRELVAGGQLKEIRIVDQATNRQGHQLSGWFDNGVVYLTTDIVSRFSTVDTERFPKLDYSTGNPNDLTFPLGFMAARAQNANSHNMERMNIQERMKKASSKLEPNEKFDITPYMRDTLSLELRYTARAYINGWGALRDAAESQNGENLDISRFAKIMMKSRTFPILNSAINKGKFNLQSNGYIPSTPYNISAVVSALNEFSVPEFD